MNTSITIVGYLPMPERTAIDLRNDWNALQLQIVALVNGLVLTDCKQWQVDDYRSLRQQQMAIESDLKVLLSHDDNTTMFHSELLIN